MLSVAGALLSLVRDVEGMQDRSYKGREQSIVWGELLGNFSNGTLVGRCHLEGTPSQFCDASCGIRWIFKPLTVSAKTCTGSCSKHAHHVT